MKCIKCHQEIEKDVQFCPYCGRAVDSKWALTSQLLVETKGKTHKTNRGLFSNMLNRIKSK